MLSQFAAVAVSNPALRGITAEANLLARIGERGNGPYFYLYLAVDSGVIRKASFESNGCQTSITVGSVLCALLSGRTLEAASLVSIEDLRLLVGDVPPAKGDVLDRAMLALTSALTQR